jgi:hypothetical protein
LILFHDDEVHGTCEVGVYFLEDVIMFDGRISRLKVPAVCGHIHDSVNLLRVQLGQFLCRHIIDEKVVSNLRISIYTLLVSLSYSLGEDSGVLSIKK